MSIFQPLDVQVPNFIGILQAAQQYRANQENIAFQQQERARQQQARLLTGAYLAAPMGSQEQEQAGFLLRQTAPEEYLGIHKALDEQQTGVLQRRLLEKQLEPAPLKPAPLSSIGAVAAESLGLDPNDPATRRNPAFQEAVKEEIKNRRLGRTTPQVSVSVGTQQPLEKGIRGKFQEKAIDTGQSIANFEKIKEFDPGEYLGFYNRSKDAVLKFANNLGVSSEAINQRIANSTKFDGLVSREFNKYRVAITGAAGAVEELKRLQTSFIGKDQSPAEFAAARDTYYDELRRNRRLYNTLLSKGLDTRTEEGGQALDELFLSGNEGKSPEDIAYRDFQLEKSGVRDPAKRHEILAKEGYFE